jgi:hypothetical protein
VRSRRRRPPRARGFPRTGRGSPTDLPSRSRDGGGRSRSARR